MKNYNRYISDVNELISKTSIKENEVFLYENSPHSEDFDFVYDYYKANIEHNYEYGVIPCFVYFNNNLSTNAKACKENGLFIISFNMGFVVELIKLYSPKEINVSYNLHKDYFELESKLDVSLIRYMYQVARQFTFYHEFAHLIQNSEYLEMGLEELSNKSVKFDHRKHILEIDADQFSGKSIGAHILQYIDVIFEGKISAKEYLSLLTITCSSILIYLLSFNSSKEKLYFKDYDHPHPIIRVFLIVISIINYCKDSIQAKENNVDIISMDLLNMIFEYCTSIAPAFESESILDNYKRSIDQNVNEIVDYIKQYEKEINKDQSLASNKWEQVAKMIMENE